MKYLKIKEASELTGKSEITIRRDIRKLLKNKMVRREGGKGLKDKVITQMITQMSSQMISQMTSQKIKKDKTSKGLVYKIRKDYLEEKYKVLTQMPTQMSSQKEKMSKQMTSQKENNDYSNDKAKEDKGKPVADIIEILREQLKTKDEQISRLISAQERSDILLKGIQDKVLMLEAKTEERPKEEPEEKRKEEMREVLLEEIERRKIAREERAKKKAEKKGFFRRLFS